ncbi:MAG: TAXI family TRAP transporter solute-binding subunit [Aquisalimonadaceae bacterium]
MFGIKTVLAASTIVALTLAGSAHADKQFTIDIPEQTVAAGSTGGSWFITSTALFDLFNDHIEGLRYNIVPGGGVSNPISVHRGEASVAMGYTTNLHSAYSGEEPYEEAFKDLRAVANINVASVLHPFILTDAPVNSLKELGDKRHRIRIDTGTRGTGGELAAARTLAAHGASYDNIRGWGGSVSHSAYSEAMDRLKDGHIDAFMNDDIIRNPSFVDLTLARDVKLLPLNPSIIEELAGNYGYTPTSIPAGSYKDQNSDIPTIAQHHVVFAHKDTSEELVYAMVKLMFENKERLVQAHPLFENLDVAEGPKNFPIPLHPGAERFYREAGVLD